MRKMILLGDSITAGYENGEIDCRLNQKINDHIPNLEVINAGIPGDTTKNALKRVDQHVCRYHPDWVTLFFGANDVSCYSGITLEEFAYYLEKLIETIGEEKCLLLGVPFANQVLYKKERPIENIMRYNKVVKQLAAKYRIPFIDVLGEMMKEGVELMYLQQDGLHFSTEGYELLGSLIAKEIKDKVGE